MKNLLLTTILCLFISGLSAQDINSMSEEQLIIAKKQAVKQENYELAQKINVRLNSFKSPEQLTTEFQDKLAIALKNEQYEEAALLKKKLVLLNEIDGLSKKITTAVAKENFQKANELKVEREKLMQQVLAEKPVKSTAKSNTSASANANQDGVVTLVFKKVNKGLYDIVLGDKYIGTVNKESDLVLTNVSTGSHKLVVYSADYGIKDKHAFENTVTFKTAGTYVSSLNNITPRMVKENIKAHKKDRANPVSVFEFHQDNTVNPSSSESKDVNQLSFQEPDMREATFGYTKVQTNLSARKAYPETAETKRGMNFGFESTTPLVKNTGIVMGGGFHYTYVYYMNPSTEYMFGNAFVSIGYQMELSDYFTLQALVRTGPNFYYDTPENYDEDGITSWGYGSYASFNGLFFFNEKQRTGISTELNVGFKGGVGFTCGLVWGMQKKPQYRHKMHQ